MKMLERFGGIAGLAGVGCYFYTFVLIVLAPAVLTNAGDPVVTDIHGNPRDVAPYTKEELAGKQVYMEQVCWHCHSQFIRPVNDEWRRWGPVSQPGESALDKPHLFSTRRIGPDLTREGGRRVDDWHFAHFYNPRFTVGASVMPGFTWLFKEGGRNGKAEEILGLVADLDSDGDGLVTPEWDDKTYWTPDPADAMKVLQRIQTRSTDIGGVIGLDQLQKESGEDMWPKADGSRDYVDKFVGYEMGDNILSNQDARPWPTEEARNLTTYLQRLGTSIGHWRNAPVMGTPSRGYVPPMVGVEDVKYVDSSGKEQKVGIGDGLMPMRHYEARRYGLAWERAGPEERGASKDLAREYDALMAAWLKANPEWDHRLERGKELFTEHCAGCHGEEGRGNGDATPWLVVRPRDFTRAKYRYRSTPVGNRPLDGDLFRSIFVGLWGTSMPSWKELPSEHIWLLVDYIKHFAEQNAGDRGRPWNDVSKRTAIPELPPLDVAAYDKTVLRGKAVYMASNCSNCHGTEGRGDGPGAMTVKDNGGTVRSRDLTPRDAKDNPRLRMRGGATAEDLWRTIFNGLDGTGMPANHSGFYGSAGVFAQATKLEELKAAGAPQDQVDAAAKAARRKFFQPLKDPELFALGVVADKDENGNYAEFVPVFRPTLYDPNERGVQFGDDWAMILYVMHLLRTEEEVAAGVMAWPKMVSEED